MIAGLSKGNGNRCASGHYRPVGGRIQSLPPDIGALDFSARINAP